jgi:hypothetical protein
MGTSVIQETAAGQPGLRKQELAQRWVHQHNYPHPLASHTMYQQKGVIIEKGWIQDKPCLVTMDTRASVTITRPDITVGLPNREPSQPCILQMVSRETLPVLKEALVVHTMNLSVCHKHHGQVHPRARHYAWLQ